MRDLKAAAAAQNRGPETIAVIGTLAVLAALFTSLRLLARRMSKTRLWIDDYLIMFAMAICVTLLGLAVRTVKSGTGQHMKDLRPSTAIQALKILFATQFLYTWCLASVKLSILSQLWRIFSIMDRFRVSAYILMALIVLWTIATTVTGLSACQPLHAFWDDPSGSRCISAEKYFFASAIVNIFTTMALIVVPIPFVCRLPIKSWQRAGVILTFALGCFTIIVSFYRINVVHRHKASADITWSFTNIIIWSAVEYSVAILCANIPALAPLVRSLLRRFYYSQRVALVRRSVVHRLSVTPARNTTRVSWLQQPAPVAESSMRLHRPPSSADEIIMLHDDDDTLGGSAYVRGHPRLNHDPTDLAMLWPRHADVEAADWAVLAKGSPVSDVSSGMAGGGTPVLVRDAWR